MSAHMRVCSQRAMVKMEYVNDPEAAAYNQTNLKLLEFDQRPDQEYKPLKNSGGASLEKSSNKKRGSNNSKNLSSVSRGLEKSKDSEM